jgi:hypothetical protein
MHIKDTIDLQIAFNTEHHKLKRHVLRTVYRAYEAAWSELVQTINHNDNVLEETILDHYLALGNHIEQDEIWKFLNTLVLLTPMINKLETLEIIERSKIDCKKTIYITLCDTFWLSLQN